MLAIPTLRIHYTFISLASSKDDLRKAYVKSLRNFFSCSFLWCFSFLYLYILGSTQAIWQTKIYLNWIKLSVPDFQNKINYFWVNGFKSGKRLSVIFPMQYLLSFLPCLLPFGMWRTNARVNQGEISLPDIS